MTVATGYLGKREYHGALARHSPFTTTPVRCVVCSTLQTSRAMILHEICWPCRHQGWYSPRDEMTQRASPARDRGNARDITTTLPQAATPLTPTNRTPPDQPEVR